MAELLRMSPLEHRAPIAAGGMVTLQQLPFVGKFLLRGKADILAAKVKKVMSLSLPVKPCSSSSDEICSILWLGPDEWMVITPPETEKALMADLHKAFSKVSYQLADVTDYYTILELGGQKSRELLMKLTPLDMHARAFQAGEVRGTNLGHAQSTLYLRSEGEAKGEKSASSQEDEAVFWLTIRWSMTDYLWCLLAHAGREWGLAEQHPINGEPMVIA